MTIFNFIMVFSSLLMSDIHNSHSHKATNKDNAPQLNHILLGENDSLIFELLENGFCKINAEQNSSKKTQQVGRICKEAILYVDVKENNDFFIVSMNIKNEQLVVTKKLLQPNKKNQVITVSGKKIRIKPRNSGKI